ncbi:primase-like DNA-binding domain-containing protein [Bacillus cytotoxicus]|uniref:primase-like DNA-binding domain-containing protein n=1 Tax=unclassified Bacillus cereus group TaxID=2750818 RepID=UPI0037BE707B
MFEKFIEENIERDIKSFETNNMLYERYKKFCRFYQIEIMTKRKFSIYMRKHNIGVRHKRMKNYLIENGRWGVKLLPCKY